MSDIEKARTRATEAREAAVAADLARRAGSPDREVALKLEADFVAAASAARYFEGELARLAGGTP